VNRGGQVDQRPLQLNHPLMNRPQYWILRRERELCKDWVLLTLDIDAVLHTRRGPRLLSVGFHQISQLSSAFEGSETELQITRARPDAEANGVVALGTCCTL